MSKSVSLLLFNFRSVYKKLDAINALVYTCSADIVVGTESWLTEDVTNSELSFPPSFVLFRKDRMGCRGGGVIIAIKEIYQPSLLPLDSPLEIVWVSSYFDHIHCIIGACYRPPDSRQDFVELLQEAIDSIFLKFPNCFLILGGDFNYPSINWSTLSVPVHPNRHEQLSFLRLLNYHNLQQLVQEPTRGNNILDLIITNHPDSTKVQILEEISDHRAVHCTLPLPHANKTNVRKDIFNYARADTDKLNRLLQSFSDEYISSFPNQSTEQNWCLFRDKLKEIERLCVPVITITERADDPWFTHDIKRWLNRKKRAYTKASRTNASDDWQNYKKVSKQTEAAIIEAKNKYYNDTLPNLFKTDPKKFWSTVNPKKSESVPALCGEDGNTLSLAGCAEKLNHFFSEVHTIERPLDSNLNLPQLIIPNQFSPITITAHGVACAIDRLALKTSPGPDGISAKLLKLTSHFSASLLALIFQQSLDTGCLPVDWKSAYVIPIFKSGDNTQPNNYRPISLTSICCKLLEHILFTNIMAHLNLNNLLLNNQHGFRQNFSCQSQLFELITDLHSALNSSRRVDAIFIDFSKAFDKVPYKRLELKIRNLKLDNNTTQWILEFLSNRFQSVKLKSYISNPTSVLSGVPQGSVLGPLLFLIYINDIACNISSQIRLFADDCVIYKEITSPADNTFLQSDLDRLAEWCDTWQMEINVGKTKHLEFSSALIPSHNTYTINDSRIESVQSFKYLGVFFTANLNWTTHIEHITNKAIKKLGILKRRLYLANKETRLHSYISLIRPSLEYASIIWHPPTENLTYLVESIQNKAARFITSSYSRYESVTALLKSLNLPSLATRRKLARLSFFHSLFHSNSPFARNHILSPSHISARVDHPNKVNPIFPRTKKFQNSPLALSITDWNFLPGDIATLTEPSSFLKAVKVFLEIPID